MHLFAILSAIMNCTLRLISLFLLALAGCTGPSDGHTPWSLYESTRDLVSEAEAGRIFRALEAAADTGTDPPISRYDVRVATVLEQDGIEHIITGGNTEYHLPEAIHGETSLLNHVASLLGGEATRRVGFLAFYTEGSCGPGYGCGDCRDYMIAKTDWQNLVLACGQISDHTVHLKRFADGVVDEEQFPLVEETSLSLPESELQRLVEAAREAQRHGVTLFTTSQHHAGAAGLSTAGHLYKAAGADDAAFHYRYPIGGLLQQAAAGGDYFIRAIVVAGEEGQWPRISYRDRQYGFESSSFNLRHDLQPIQLILTDGQGSYRLTTFEDALPSAFSTSSFMPQAVEEFLEKQIGN